MSRKRRAACESRVSHPTVALGMERSHPPYDTEGVADTLKHAIEMSREEKAHRMARLHMHLAEHNIYKWLADIFTTLEHIQGASDSAALAAMEAPGGGTPALDDL